MTIKQVLPVLTLVIASLACGAKKSEVVIENVVARKPPTGTNITAVFLTLKNNTGMDIALVGAHSDVANVTEVHESYNDNGIARMRRLEQIPIRAGGELVMQPGGFHIMLIDLKRELLENEQIPLKLSFSGYRTITVPATVKTMGGMAHH